MGVLSEGSAAVMVEVSDRVWGDPSFPRGVLCVPRVTVSPPLPPQVNCETDFVARTPDFQQLVEMAARGVLGHCQGASGTKVGDWRGGGFRFQMCLGDLWDIWGTGVAQRVWGCCGVLRGGC